MILSVSRRTDIPACYPEWFLRRLEEGVVMSRNPMNPRQVSRIVVSPETVDCIVFWTKNPAPLLPYLARIEALGYTYMFQLTLNAYGKDVEASLPPLPVRLDTVRRIADRIGRERIVWRYDPVLLSDAYSVDWHEAQFLNLVQELAGSVDHGVISFLDVYGKNRARLRAAGLRECTEEQMHALAARLSRAAADAGLLLQTCAERIDLSPWGIEHGACIDAAHISRILGCPINPRRDANQRSACGCIPSIDVGEYDTCRNGCVYCYANHGAAVVESRIAQHRIGSPLLVGFPAPDDRVTERKGESRRLKAQQMTLL